jgi:Ca-activated chloride channel homolog
MSTELDRLAKALKAAKPGENPDRKAEILALARKKFDAAQETAVQPRPIHKPTQNASGIWTGVINMFRSINLRPALYATTALGVGGLAVILTIPLIDRPYGQFDVADMPAPVELKAVPKDEYAGRTRTDSALAPAPVPQKQLKENILLDGSALSDNKVKKRDLAAKTAAKPQSVVTVTPNNQPTVFAESEASGVLSRAIESDRLATMSQSIVDPETSILPNPDASGETFANETPNPLKIVTDEPVSTFSIDVDTASYAYVRSAIQGGSLPAAAAVRIEEMINYFPYNYPTPDMSKAPFSTQVSVFQTPWNKNTKLLHIGIQGAKPEIDNRPPLNLVFLIDTSGSMNSANKLPLLKQSFRLLLNSLRPSDKIAIVTYAGSAGTVLQPTAASEKDKILNSLEHLSAGGSTAGQAGLRQAYALAETMQSDNSVGRILLATDGDFNVGISNPEELKSFVEEKRNSGVYLSVFGFGRGNYRDDMMQTLAQNGNGVAAYIDTLSEAQKVMVDQVSGALFPIANDVKIQVEFNPDLIAEYRLIGYETRALNREDFNNDAVDAGEIGAGHTVTAIYEITPVGSPAIKNDALRYKKRTVSSDTPNEYGFLKLRYKLPGETKSKLITTPIAAVSTEPGQEARFAAAIAGFGQLLTKSKYLGDWDMQQNIALANASKGDDLFGYRAEAIQLMRLANSLK